MLWTEHNQADDKDSGDETSTTTTTTTTPTPTPTPTPTTTPTHPNNGSPENAPEVDVIVNPNEGNRGNR